MDAKRARVAAAEDHAFAGDFAAAAAALREACDDDPADPELWFLQGYYQARGGMLDEAARSLGEALAIDPDHGQAHRFMANCLRDMGQMDPAANHYRRALDQLDDDADAIADFGLHHLRGGDGDLAAVLFKRALELDPDCELARRGLEAVRPDEEPPPEPLPAIADYSPPEPEPPIPELPPAPRPRRDRRLSGPAARSAGADYNGAPAEPAATEPPAKAPPDPTEPQPTSLTALIFASDVDWQAVAEEAETAANADGEDFDAWLRLGGALVRMRDFERAVPVLERVMARTEGRGTWSGVHAEALGLLAEVLLEKKDALAAYRLGQSLSRLYPNLPRTLYLTGRISHLCGDPRQALRSLREAARLDPEGPVGRVAQEAIDQMGG